MLLVEVFKDKNFERISLLYRHLPTFPYSAYCAKQFLKPGIPHIKTRLLFFSFNTYIFISLTEGQWLHLIPCYSAVTCKVILNWPLCKVEKYAALEASGKRSFAQIESRRTRALTGFNTLENSNSTHLFLFIVTEKWNEGWNFWMLFYHNFSIYLLPLF